MQGGEAREAYSMRAHLCAVVVVLLVLGAAAGQAAVAETVAQAATCAKADFEAVVNEAGAALRDLTQQNLPLLQGKLRQLKDKRSWSNDEFPKQVEALVSDETVAGYNKRSDELVTRITGGGAQGETATAAPDCALLTSLQGDLKQLVDTQKAKWTHVLAKVEAELGK
jgi:hypothetical protein